MYSIPTFYKNELRLPVISNNRMNVCQFNNEKEKKHNLFLLNFLLQKINALKSPFAYY